MSGSRSVPASRIAADVLGSTSREISTAKGHYAKARRGESLNFTGIHSHHEPPEIRVDTKAMTLDEAADYRAHYTPELVGRIYSEDIDRFGFDF